MEITLSKDKIALIDDEDFEKIAHLKWYAKYNNGRWKAVARITEDGKRKMLFMHRLILGPETDEVIIHINGDCLDNRKENLRVGDTMTRGMYKRTQKNKTHSQYKGVCFHKGRNKWCAHIGTEKKRLFLGLYATEIEAAEAYDCAALYYFKEFAQTNGLGLAPKSKEQIAADRRSRSKIAGRTQTPVTPPRPLAPEGPRRQPGEHPHMPATPMFKREPMVLFTPERHAQDGEQELMEEAMAMEYISSQQEEALGWRVQSLDFRYLEGLSGCDPMLGF